MLDKTAMTSGTKLQIRNDRPLKSGLIGFGATLGPDALPYVTMRLNQIDGPAFPLYPNDTIEVIHGPKKIQGLNVVKVGKPTGEEGYIFWCELRANGVIPQPTASPSPPASSVSLPSPSSSGPKI